MRTDNALNDFLTAKYRKPVAGTERAPEEFMAGSLLEEMCFVASSKMNLGTVVRCRLPDFRFRDVNKLV